ncbi:hypothetical protein LguiA_006183 [Lonicera macranthoides]
MTSLMIIHSFINHVDNRGICLREIFAFPLIISKFIYFRDYDKINQGLDFLILNLTVSS